MPRIAIAGRAAADAAMTDVIETTSSAANVGALGTGPIGGLALGSSAFFAGSIASAFVTRITGLPPSVARPLSIAGAGALLVNYLGTSQLALGLKVGSAAATIFWSTRAGSGVPTAGVSEQRRLE